jgi:class 3 adenylate cyclase
MGAETTSAVLFADVSGSTQLYEAAGDERAAQAIARCMQALREATELAGGRVVKEIGDEVMALFASPDAAASAATRMHFLVDALAPVGTTKLGLRIGFQAGPVIERDNDIFGDTVNLASRLAGQAAKGQVLTSEETAALLSPAVRTRTRTLYSVHVKGKADSVTLCELLWRQGADITDIAGNTAAAPAGKLWLKHRGADIDGWDPTLHVGRDKDCHLVVTGENASRQHCTIERRLGKFVVRDHSTNGTYVTVEGEPEFVLHREEYILRGHGWISFGDPRAQASDPLEYFCE